MGGTMSNMESLYKEFKEYFDAGREGINYFLDVLKAVKEDRWDYEYEKLTLPGSVFYIIKTLKYDNIKINYNCFYNSDNDECSGNEITVKVDNVKIFETDDETNELAIEIIDFIERVEKRAKGEK